MKIWAISDTHGYHAQLEIPEADLLIHAGDSTNYKELVYNQTEFESFFKWLVELPIKYKVIVAGNHDGWATMPDNIKRLREAGIIYLENELVTIEGINIYGSPYTPTFYNWYFMADYTKRKQLWSAIPLETDILITHGPPKGILDVVDNNIHVGDDVLSEALKILPTVSNHVFGHIHNNLWNINSGSVEVKHTTFRNCSCVTDNKFDLGLTSNGQIFNL